MRRAEDRLPARAAQKRASILGTVLALVVLIAVCALAGCKGKGEIAAQRTVEEPGEAPRLASTVHTGDPKMAAQLVAGFYGIENGAWRWTGKQFAVQLAAPAGASQNGAKLTLAISVPDVSIEKLHSLTLSGSVNGTALAPETYSKGGQYKYERDVPASALGASPVKVEFQVDKTMSPGNGDIRELGVIVLSAGLDSK